MGLSRRTRFVLVVATLVLISFSSFVSLTEGIDYTSTNFILRDPVVTIQGGKSTSTSFEYFSSTGQTTTGETTSSTFVQRAGFLYFPVATSPVVAATAGDEKVDLSWTTSVGTLANITDYQVGTATISGGPYTFESVGNVLSFTKTALTNDTTHYFIVRANAGTLRLAQSSEVSAQPIAPTVTPPTGGGGGGVAPPPITRVIFSGRAYPKSTVTLLKDAQIAVTTIAGTDANFTITLSGLSSGNYIFGVYSEDKEGRRSSLLTFPISVTSGATTRVSGIFIAPTIAVDKSEVKRGNNIAIFGESAPQADIIISVNSHEEFFSKTISDKDGIYLYNFDTTPLEIGQHFTKSKASIGNLEISSFSTAISFRVGIKDVAVAPPVICPPKADLNNDCRVNLIDFSIAAFWYKRTISAEFALKEAEHLNGDGKVDLVDFSIMAFYWTG